MNSTDDLFKNAIPFDDNQRPVTAEFKDGMLLVTLKDERVIGTPIAWYPRLANATLEQLAKVELSTFEPHWEELDEDLGVEGMLLGVQPKSLEVREIS